MKIDLRSPRRLARNSLCCCTLAALAIALPHSLQAQRLPDTVRPQHYSLTLTPESQSRHLHRL